MRIVVVGAGAMGSCMGGILAMSGNEVTLYDVDRDHMSAITRDGLRLVDGAEPWATVHLPACSDPDELGPPAEVVLVMTKSWSTTDALTAATSVVDHRTWIVSAQNGLGNADRMAASGSPAAQIMGGTTTVGATVIEAGVVQISGTVSSGSSLTQFGLPAGISPTEQTETLAATFTAAGLTTEILADVNNVIWTKLCMAGTAGCLTALAQVTIGDLYASPEGMDTWRRMLDEIFAVARAEGVDLDEAEVAEHALTTYRTVGPHWASMAVDVRERRRTEIDAMCVEISKLGRRHNIATPVNDTVGDMILAVERSWSD
ncbi:MAG: ketopantoate reductase family protein [Acidimicrobiales bacterium]